MKESEGKIKKIFLESGIEVKPCYYEDDIKDIKIERPGEFPFTRGIHPLMYRQQPWTMRQYAGFGTPQETNERFKVLISHGQNALNVAFDLPTQLGLDSDDDIAYSEVGRVGMAVDTIEDIEIAFSDIPIEKVSVSLTINSVATVLVAMYLSVAEKRGVSIENIRGTAQNDILKEYLGRGTWIFPVQPSIKLVCDLIEYCTKFVPKYYPVSVCGYHIRESGALPHQEIGYAYEIAKTYMDETIKRGLDVDSFAPRFTFNFNVFGNLWEQVAKFRAARRVWAKILKDDYNSKDAKSMQMKMIAGGGGSGLTIEEPENNIIRGAYYALIGALGGTQTMALCCYDEAYTIPSEKASLLSLRTMQILAEEMGLCDTVDPLAGSYYIEWLTSQMEKKIRESMNEITQMGGIVNAITTGLLQKKLAQQAFDYEKKIRSGEIVKVGVNKYKITEKQRQDVELHKYDQKAVDEKIKRLNEIKSSRSISEVQKNLDAIKMSIEKNENIMPAIMSAVKSYATLGEITRILKSYYGEFKEPPLF